MVCAVNRLPQSPRDRIRDRALSLGFDAVGFCEARLGPEARDRLAAFVASGLHGDMGWLAARTEQRAQPGILWPEARTVIALALSYAPDGDPLAPLGLPDRGTISAYARGRDYHDLMKGRLKHLAAFVASRFDAGVKVFVDTAPVMEKPLGEAAGLGWVGQAHQPRFPRAWVVVVPGRGLHDAGTAARSAARQPLRHLRPVSGRVSDRRVPGSVPVGRHAVRFLSDDRAQGTDPTRFAAADGQPDLWLRRLPGGVPVEPVRAVRRTHAALLPREELLAPRLAELAALDDAAFRALFAGSPIKRIGRDRFVRNVLNAIGNSGDATLRPAAERADRRSRSGRRGGRAMGGGAD